MIASIVIATRNRASLLPTAINAALCQTVPVEVIVIDDGSVDRTRDLINSYKDDIRARWQEQAGVAAARNRGIEEARAPFLCFLDDDDVIQPYKIERQIAALRTADWCLCDTIIVDEISKKTELASVRYGYGAIVNVAAELQQRNFIPVHAPLLRRSAIGDLRFPEGKLEDWAFWRAFAQRAGEPVRISDCLATYHKRKSGRNSEK